MRVSDAREEDGAIALGRDARSRSGAGKRGDGRAPCF